METSTASDEPASTPVDGDSEDVNEDEAIVEDVSEDEKKDEEPAPKKMKSVLVEEWVQLNANPPLWARFVIPPPFVSILAYIYVSATQKTSRMVCNCCKTAYLISYA